MKKLKLNELGRVTVEEFKAQAKVPLVVICDNIRSAINVGSIFRTADAMGIDRVLLCGISATPPNKEITKSAIGATDSMNWKYFKTTAEAIHELKNEGYLIYAIEQIDKSVELLEFEVSQEKMAVLMGNEVMGVSDDVLPLLDGAIEIDQFGTKHSLNVSVCAGIVLHHLSSKIRRR